MDLPLYILDIDESAEDETSVFAVGLVEHPAIERNWMAFAAVKEQFAVVDSEKRIVAGPLMVADQPIYRRDETGREFYVSFPSKSIEKIVTKYARAKQALSFNINHNDDAKVSGAFLMQHPNQTHPTHINTPEGFEKLLCWVCLGLGLVDDEEVWNNEIKSGNLKGFSVEGYFNDIKLLDAPQDVYEELKKQPNTPTH